MKVTDLAPDRITRQIIMDMAPTAYEERRHDDVL